MVEIIKEIENTKQNDYMENAIKIILAILFFICLADMPYGYYQIVRFAGMLGFVFLS